MVSENLKYGGVRVVPRISLRKLHNLLRFTVHFVNLAIQALSENDIRRELRRITIGVD